MTLPTPVLEELEEKYIKHLPGQHDQMKHAGQQRGEPKDTRHLLSYRRQDVVDFATDILTDRLTPSIMTSINTINQYTHSTNPQPGLRDVVDLAYEYLGEERRLKGSETLITPGNVIAYTNFILEETYNSIYNEHTIKSPNMNLLRLTDKIDMPQDYRKRFFLDTIMGSSSFRVHETIANLAGLEAQGKFPTKITPNSALENFIGQIGKAVFYSYSSGSGALISFKYYSGISPIQQVVPDTFGMPDKLVWQYLSERPNKVDNFVVWYLKDKHGFTDDEINTLNIQSYIQMHTGSPDWGEGYYPVAEWMVNKVKTARQALMKRRTVLDPDGHVRTYQLLHRLDEIEPSDLVNGYDTGVEAAFAHAKTRQDKEFIDQIGGDMDAKFPETTPKGNDKVRLLDTPRKLRNEGLELNHCLQSNIPYYQAAINGTAAFYSVKVGDKRSTLHIHKDQSNNWNFVQHRAYSNSVPDFENDRAANEWMKANGIEPPGEYKSQIVIDEPNLELRHTRTIDELETRYLKHFLGCKSVLEELEEKYIKHQFSELL